MPAFHEEPPAAKAGHYARKGEGGIESSEGLRCWQCWRRWVVQSSSEMALCLERLPKGDSLEVSEASLVEKKGE